MCGRGGHAEATSSDLQVIRMRELTSDPFYELIGKYDDFSLEPVRPDSQRLLWVCKKTAKQ